MKGTSAWVVGPGVTRGITGKAGPLPQAVAPESEPVRTPRSPFGFGVAAGHAAPDAMVGTWRGRRAKTAQGVSSVPPSHSSR